METADAKEHPGTSSSEHHSCLTSRIHQHAQAPESFGGTKKVTSPCVADSHDNTENTEGLRAESCGEWPASWLRFHCCHGSLQSTEAKGAMKLYRERWDRVWGTKEGGTLKTSKYYQAKIS